MQICVNINGEITGSDQASIPIFDHGFLYGDNIYEAFRTYQRKLFLFSRHYERLQQSAHGIFMTVPWPKERIRQEIVRTLEFAKHPAESTVRLIVTRGIGPMTADPETCHDQKVIIIVAPFPELPRQMYTDGVEMTISSIPRGGMVAANKTGNLMHQVLAMREARARHAYDAILLTTNGFISDGIACNVHMIQGSRLKTPGREASIIEGITKGAVLSLSRDLGLEVVEGLFHPDEIWRSDEMFLTSTNREVVPIVRVVGRPIGNGRPGPWTARIHEAYKVAVERLILED